MSAVWLQQEVAREPGLVDFSAPTRFRVHEGTRWAVRWRWFNPLGGIFFLFGALLGSAASVAMFAASNIEAPLWAKVWVLVVVSLLDYYTLCLIFNETRIEAGEGRLAVRHGPLPSLAREVDLDAARVVAFRPWMSVIGTKNGATRTRYSLSAVDKDGNVTSLSNDLQSMHEALWLEHALQTRLGIEPYARIGGARPAGTA